jgi:hypothetical protein
MVNQSFSPNLTKIWWQIHEQIQVEVCPWICHLRHQINADMPTYRSTIYWHILDEFKFNSKY